MRPMMDGAVRERLGALVGGRRLLRRALRIAGRSESRVDERIAPIYRRWLEGDPRIETTILASPGFVEVHLATQVEDVERGQSAVDAAAAALHAAMGPDVVSGDGATLEATLGQMLRERGWRIALAESCTGGLAASRMTDVAGSSDYVDRGWVVYSNEAKRDALGVPDTSIAAHGAVSEAVACAMAEGALQRSLAQVAVGITGIAGPGGGSDSKPVGLVWIAVARADWGEVRAARCRFLGGREMVKTFAAVTALDLTRRWLLDAPWDVDWIWRQPSEP
jgi:nicotinamide-nucleotide amidase